MVFSIGHLQEGQQRPAAVKVSWLDYIETAWDINNYLNAFGGRLRKDDYKRINAHLAKLGIVYDWKEGKYFQWVDKTTGENASFEKIPEDLEERYDRKWF